METSIGLERAQYNKAIGPQIDIMPERPSLSIVYSQYIDEAQVGNSRGCSRR